jgi:hypothetical protein
MNLIVSAAAVATATSVAAQGGDGSPVDPAFAAIQAWRDADRLDCEAMDAVEAAGGSKCPAKLRRRADATAEAYRAARERLANTVPTTPEGLVAVVSFIRELHEADCAAVFDGEESDLFFSIEASVRQLTGVGQSV